MKKRNVITALAATAMMLQIIGVGPALAVDPEVKFTFTPISGLAGTKVDFRGTGCPHDAARTSDGVFLLTADGRSGQPVGFVSVADGTFSGQYDTAGLSPGAYTTLVSCLTTNVSGVGEPFTVAVPPPPPAPPVPPAPVGSTYSAIAPVRVLDTRDGTGAGGVVKAVGPDGVVELKVTGVAGVPTSGVTAVALNVTATNASANSHLKVWPTGSPQPDASNLNFSSGATIPNLVIARVGTDGKVSLRNNGGTVDVIADVQGWYSDTGTAGSRYVPVNPQRILDTRDGTGVNSATQVGPSGTIELGVTGVAGVPQDATAVVLNMTVDQATGPESYITVWPSGTAMPTASNLNFTEGPASTNLVIARVGASGKVAVYNHMGSPDVIADVQGWFAAPASTVGSAYFPTNPARILDSRTGTGTPGGAIGQLGTDGTIDITVVGAGGVPSSGVSAVVLNVTVTDSPGPDSYITLFPAGTARPVASNLNYSAGETVPNLVIVRVNDGKVSMFNHVGSTNVIADVQGWFGPGS